MKPRLKLYRGVWQCWRVGTNFHVYCGQGYTPTLAYEDWKRLIAKTEEA